MSRCRKHKNKIDYRTKDYYYAFNAKNPGKFSQKDYSKILKTFFSLVINKIINNMFRFHFTGIGLFYIIKRKQQHKQDENGDLVMDAGINWPATKEVWKTTGEKKKFVYYLNDHTFGHRYGIFWNSTKQNFVNKTFYAFLPAQKFQLQLSTTLYKVDKPLNAYMV